MKSYKEIFEDQTIWRTKDGKFHREDGPAVEWANGDKSWYINDKLHRTDGPAIEYASGSKEWYQNGQLHRTDGPAVIKNDFEFWYINDELQKVAYKGTQIKIR